MNTLKSVKVHFARISTLFLAILLTATIAPQILNIKTASADDGGYPWVGATQLFTSTNVTYDWGYSTCPSNAPGCMGIKMIWNGTVYGEEDPYTMEFRNCTSYAAWKINQYISQSFSGWGNASSWYTKAPAADVHAASGYTPVFGDLALWNSAARGLGHVAFVSSVDSNGIASLDEYNSGLPKDSNGNLQWGLFYSGRTTASNSANTPDYYIHFSGISNSGGSGGGGSSGPSMPYAQNLVSNSGFNSSSNFNHWNIYPGTNYANYTASSGITPFEGDQYLATNAYQTGGSIYQDTPTTTSAGQDYCFSVMLTTADTSGGGSSGSIALLNMNSGTVVDAGVTYFNGLPNNSQWQRTEVCTPTTGAGNNLRVQIYPSVNGKTIGVDAATLNLDAAANGGFEQGSGSWSITQNTNYANYGANNPAAGGAEPYEGSHFEATNAYGAQASIYQDLAISLSNGNEYCVNAMLTTADGSGVSGGFGDLNLYAMNGGTVVSAGGTHFSGLPNNNQWVPVNTCVYITGTANALRVQVYPGYGSPTLGVDAVNVNQDLVANGGFEAGMGWWSTYPGTNTATYGANNGLTGGTNPPEGSNFGATNAYQAGGSIYQDIAIPTSAGQTYCVTAQLTTADQSGTTGGSGSLNLFNLNSGSVVNVGSTNFSNLPNNNQWQQVETCVDITGTGNDLRVQMYPTVNGKTLGVDAVNVF